MYAIRSYYERGNELTQDRDPPNQAAEEGGRMFIRETIRILDSLEISEADRAAIYHGNIGRLVGRNFGAR